MTTPPEPSFGIYRIDVSGEAQLTCLTRERGNVTILPPSVQTDPEQEVILRVLTSSIISHSPTVLVANHLASRWKHYHRGPPPDPGHLPYLRRRSKEARGRRPDNGACCSICPKPMAGR